MIGLIWFYNSKITDGNNNIVSEKILSLYQNVQGEIREVSPLIIWDLIPINNFDQIINSNIFSEIKNLMNDKNTIKNQVESILRIEYFENLNKKKNENYEIKKKAIENNMNLKISESISKIYQYQEKIEAGENYELALNNEKRNKEKLIYEKNQKLDQILKEKEITLNVPQLFGIMMVIPKSIIEGKEEFDKEKAIVYENGIDKNKVDDAAMKAVMQFEKDNRRKPKDVHLTRCGYDILSKDPITEEIRHIEAKGHSESGDVFITPNEWFMAGRFGDDFWLYVVDYALDNPEIFPIQNPAENLEYDKILETKRYIIKEKNWKRKSIN